MANDGLALERSRASALLAPWVAECAFVGLLLLIFVGLTPFEVREPGTFGIGAASGGGDALRQISYLAVFLVLMLVALQKRGLEIVTIIPVSLLLLLAWCLASALWANEPGVAVRRVGLEFVIVVSAMMSVDALGPARSLKLLYYVLIGVLIVNWLSIPFVAQARHLPGETDPSLVGDWRGLYFHKNIAGAVSALTAMIALYFAIERRSRLDFALFLAAVGFAAMTRSKSSLGFLPVAIVLGAVYRWAWKRDLDRLIVTVCAVLIAVVAAAWLGGHTAELSQTLESPREFTGRTAIWQAELQYIGDHPLLGSGYGTFADTGGKSPLANYIASKWVAEVAHGHNGYLQLLVTTGGIGFAFAMLALVLLPFAGLWRRDMDRLALKSLLFAIFSFAIMHNLLESDYLESDGPVWVTLLLVIAMLRTMRAPRIGNGAS